MVRDDKQSRGGVGGGEPVRDKPGKKLFLWCELDEGQGSRMPVASRVARSSAAARFSHGKCPELVKWFYRRAQVAAGFLTAALPA